MIRAVGATDASALAALDGIMSRLDRLGRGSQLMLLTASVADGLNAAAAAAAAAMSAGGARRKLTGSSAGYREQACQCCLWEGRKLLSYRLGVGYLRRMM